jgi:hypothetical protein
MKKKILIISIISLLCIAIIITGYCINKNRISKIQNSEDLELEFENNLLNAEISDNIENSEDTPEENIQEENLMESNLEEITETENTTSSEPKTSQVKTSNITSGIATNKAETKSEETVTTTTATNKETTKTNENISSTISEPKQETKVVETPTRCTNNNNHSMDVGNSEKWFSSKSEAIAYYNSQVSYWGNLWETEAINDTTYYQKCPSGYEVWDCVYCSKWTINFYYR